MEYIVHPFLNKQSTTNPTTLVAQNTDSHIQVTVYRTGMWEYFCICFKLPLWIHPGISLHFFMGQEPFQGRLRQAPAPGVVAHALQQIILQMGVGALQRLHHFHGLMGRNHGVIQSVEGPDRHFQGVGIPGHTAAAAGGDGRKEVGIGHGGVPGTETAHAKTAQIDPAGIGRKSADHFIKESADALDSGHPEGIRGALGHDENAVGQILIADNFGKSMHQHLIQICSAVSPLSRAVKLEQQSGMAADFLRNVGYVGKSIFPGFFSDDFQYVSPLI